MSIIQNPVLRGFNPDPCICRGKDAWYIAVSTFEWYPGVLIYESKDFVNWELKATPLDRLSQLNLIGEQPSGGIWAPALSYHDGLYWLVYTDTKAWKGEQKISPLRDMHNYLVTAPDITGPWSEPVHLVSGGYDPSLFHDDTGKKWLAYIRRDFRGIHADLFAGIIVREYSVDEQRLIGEERVIYEGANLQTDYFMKCQIYEAPHLMKKDDWYYLITAEGGTGYTHATCVSRSRDIFGPYEFHPQTPMLTSRDANERRIQRTGHGNLVEGPHGQWYMTYLGSRPLDAQTKRSPLGRETCIASIEWRDGWPCLTGSSVIPSESFTVESAVEQNLDSSWHVNFSRCATLPLELQSLRAPKSDAWCNLNERPGYLRIRGQESPTSRFHQSLLACRVRDWQVEVETALEFSPSSYLHMAGLMARYDESTFYYLFITRDDDGTKILSYMEMDAGSFAYNNRLAVLPENGETGLRLRIEDAKLRFSYRTDDGTWTELGLDKDFTKLSDEYATPIGFTGAFVGITANDMLGFREPADFRFFSYRQLPGESANSRS
ncbi:glycoside hydrolase family 43 [Burkholderia sp. SRS-W-2-2016]|uniref:glycoside hydrolase family 43 protein n=1 Tax=Burkholderia sp. SRS-W-2-2016 TaxID=1926878 RepID=UPI00094B20AB|nr:glycoside hydrolase family 43 protein [Burkholderia sp. SRS-W-2-2016]OLL28376.1 glycoside hydrolase family 43 [Burkholderia sp. SRS-W-2-2016]